MVPGPTDPLGISIIVLGSVILVGGICLAIWQSYKSGCPECTTANGCAGGWLRCYFGPQRRLSPFDPATRYDCLAHALCACCIRNSIRQDTNNIKMRATCEECEKLFQDVELDGPPIRVGIVY